jgi:hypothetical protein
MKFSTSIVVCVCACTALITDARLLGTDTASTVNHASQVGQKTWTQTTQPGQTHKGSDHNKQPDTADYSPHLANVGGFDVVLTSVLANTDGVIEVSEEAKGAKHSGKDSDHSKKATQHNGNMAGHKVAHASIVNSDGKVSHAAAAKAHAAKDSTSGKKLPWNNSYYGIIIASMGVVVVGAVALMAMIKKDSLDIDMSDVEAVSIELNEIHSFPVIPANGANGANGCPSTAL